MFRPWTLRPGQPFDPGGYTAAYRKVVLGRLATTFLLVGAKRDPAPVLRRLYAEIDRLRALVLELADAVVDTVDRASDVDGYHCLACDGWGERFDGVDHDDACPTQKIGGEGL